MIRTEKDSVRIRTKKLDVALLLSDQEENVRRHSRKRGSKSSRMIWTKRSARVDRDHKVQFEQLVAEKQAIACECKVQLACCEYNWKWFIGLSGCSIHPPRIVEDFANDSFTPFEECGLDASQIARIWLDK